MEKSKIRKMKVKDSGTPFAIWFCGWLFTIGFVKLAFWKAIIAIFVWPYYLGDF